MGEAGGGGGVDLQYAFGLHKGIKDNLAYVSESSIMYPVGRQVVIHNIDNNSSRFVNRPGKVHACWYF